MLVLCLFLLFFFPHWMPVCTSQDASGAPTTYRKTKRDRAYQLVNFHTKILGPESLLLAQKVELILLAGIGF